MCEPRTGPQRFVRSLPFWGGSVRSEFGNEGFGGSRTVRGKKNTHWKYGIHLTTMKMKVPFSIMHDVSVFQLWEIFEKVEFYGLGLTGLMQTYQLVRVFALLQWRQRKVRSVRGSVKKSSVRSGFGKCQVRTSLAWTNCGYFFEKKPNFWRQNLKKIIFMQFGQK